MEDNLVLIKNDIVPAKKVRTNFNEIKASPERNFNNPVIENLIAEGGENIFHYLTWLGLTDATNIMILSARHQYCYDHNDMKGVTTLINLKKLNLINHLDSFLNIVYRVVSPRTNFIGCFSDIRTQKEIEYPFGMPKRHINYSDSKTVIEIDRNDASRLLESHGFNVINMTEINGLTYFRTQPYK